nr:uncharacterized protein LOC117992030 [Maniola hyperantus]
MIVNIVVFIILVDVVSASREDVTHKVQNDDDDMPELQVFDASKYFKPITIETTKAPRPEMAGPLYNFIVNVCDAILEDFSNSRIPTYLNILRRSLKGLGSGYLMKMMVKRFAKALYDQSQYRGELIKPIVEHFLKVIKTPMPKKKELFKALNNIYTIRQDIKMDVYVYRLKRYGRKKKRRISGYTREIFKKIIFDTIRKQKDYVKRDIQLKFTLFILELYNKSISLNSKNDHEVQAYNFKKALNKVGQVGN